MRPPRRLPVALAIAVSLWLAAAPRAEATSADPPNIIFILTDDQRRDTMAMMPETTAAFGVSFRQFVVTTSNCCPSRSTFLTGKYVHNTGVFSSTASGYETFKELEPDSLATWLRARGYYTGFVGKYFNGYLRDDPVPPGWDEFYGRLYGPDKGNGTTEFTLREYGPGVIADVFYEGQYATRVFGAKAEEIIRRAAAQEKPFALFLWTIGVNTGPPEAIYQDAELPPWRRRPSFLERDMSDKPGVIRRSDNVETDATFHRRTRASQLRQLPTIDDEVGDVLDVVDELGLRETTWGFFASDNGRFWGEHRLRGKVFAYEESVRVPFRLMLPSGERRTLHAPAANIDVAPTIAALARDSSAHAFDGRSLLPLLGTAAPPWRKHVLLEHLGRPYFFCAFRSPSWKYIQHRSGAEELYNLRADPYELRNLRADDERRGLTMTYRRRVQRSACRPPRFRPLPLCTRSTGAGRDRIRGTRKRDWICAGRGGDRIDVRGGRRDVVRCGPGTDRVRAGRRDRLIDCEIRTS